MYRLSSLLHYIFFFNDTATTEIYTLSLHDALPISRRGEGCAGSHAGGRGRGRAGTRGAGRHEDLARRSDRVGRGATRRARGGGRDEADGRIGARGLRSPVAIDGPGRVAPPAPRAA